MRRISIKYFVCIVAVLFGDWLLEEIQIDDYLMVLVFALVLLLVNMTLKPLMLLISIPVNIITFGLFTLVVNSLTVQLADAFIGSITIKGFLAGLLVGTVIVLLNFILTPKYDTKLDHRRKSVKI